MENNTLAGCFISLIICAFIVLIFIGLTFWTDRTLDFWCSYFSGHTINIPLWLSALTSIISNGVMLILNIISEIVRLCM